MVTLKNVPNKRRKINIKRSMALLLFPVLHLRKIPHLVRKHAFLKVSLDAIA